MPEISDNFQERVDALRKLKGLSYKDIASQLLLPVDDLKKCPTSGKKYLMMYIKG